MSKLLKIAIFDLTGCEGCQFHLLSLNEYLLDFFQDFEITNWRLLSENDKKAVDFDIAFIEGAATTQEHIKLLKQIRETSSMVVALGACAISGNVFAQLSPEQRQRLASKIYDENYQLKAKFLEPISKYIKVDEQINGCPPDMKSFKKLLAKIKKNHPDSIKKDVVLPDYTAKIEGHGVLKINFTHKKVDFTVEESERLVEGLLLNKSFLQAPIITARICGICPISHNLASWVAIENALGIKNSTETETLRQILVCGQIIKSHLLHLFFLVLPDYAQVQGGYQLAKKYPAEFHLMLSIKRLADRALKVIGGSDAFPVNTALGGFNQVPEFSKIMAVAENVDSVIDEAEDLINLFSSIKTPSLSVQTKLINTHHPQGKYPYYPGKINWQVKEIVRSNSSSKLGVLTSGEVIKVGALARLSHSANLLNPKAKKAFLRNKPNFSNPYHNNLAQAIEIMHFLEEIVILSKQIKEKTLKNASRIEPKITKKTMQGKSSIEAPRGVLIHEASIKQNGIITNYNIIPPTQINLASLEKEIQQLVQHSKEPSPNKQKKLVEELIRAFDPCITCAVH
jgi:sulfhydrogenase subunit alpha